MLLQLQLNNILPLSCYKTFVSDAKTSASKLEAIGKNFVDLTALKVSRTLVSQPKAATFLLQLIWDQSQMVSELIVQSTGEYGFVQCLLQQHRPFPSHAPVYVTPERVQIKLKTSAMHKPY